MQVANETLTNENILRNNTPRMHRNSFIIRLEINGLTNTFDSSRGCLLPFWDCTNHKVMNSNKCANQREANKQTNILMIRSLMFFFFFLKDTYLTLYLI